MSRFPFSRYPNGWFQVAYSDELEKGAVLPLRYFDKDLVLTNLRLSLPKGGTVPSISGVLFGAFLIENEIRDQFGVTFEGLVIDYQGRLLNECNATSSNSPFCRLLVNQSGVTVAKEAH